MAATAMAPAAVLLSWLASAALAGPPLPPPPLPSEHRGGEPLPAALRSWASRGLQRGSLLQINGISQQARWLMRPNVDGSPLELWLPLEVLQNQLGVSSRNNPDGGLKLEWFGRELDVPASGLRSLDDEVSLDVSALLQTNGLSIRSRGEVLSLDLPATALTGVRSSRPGGQRRVVLDLVSPTLLRRDDNRLWLGLNSNEEQRAALEAQGFNTSSVAGGLQLQLRNGTTQRVFSLGDPARIVIDLTSASASSEPAAQARPSDPRLLSLLGRELHWDQQQLDGVRLNAVRLDPRNRAVVLRPLTRSGGMEGLSSLVQLAAGDDAVVAINGGFFNRVKRLPLGALKADGRWLSGPILGRGVMAWEPGSMPRFGRLVLQEWLSDERGQRLPVAVLNSAYLQRGLSRYTADWGSTYRALSGQESALVLRDGVVRSTYSTSALEQGVPLQPGETLVVARGGVILPWGPGERLQLSSRTSPDLGLAANVIGGGPLLLQNGRTVLNGASEGFSSSFLSQGAPRTVVASDGRELWLITLEGSSDAGPNLYETAALLQRLGLSDALNLDGGSSTGLVLGGVMTVKGRGVAGAVHHGLGLVPVGNTGALRLGRQLLPTAKVQPNAASATP